MFNLFLFRQAIFHIICYFILGDLSCLLYLFLDSNTTWIRFFIWFLRCDCLRLVLCRGQGCASLRDSSVFFSSTGSYSCLSMSFASCQSLNNSFRRFRIVLIFFFRSIVVFVLRTYFDLFLRRAHLSFFCRFFLHIYYKFVIRGFLSAI